MATDLVTTAKRQAHLLPGNSFGFISKVTEGPLFVSSDVEIHVPYLTTWYLISDDEYHNLKNVDRVIAKLLDTAVGRTVLRMAGFDPAQ